MYLALSIRAAEKYLRSPQDMPLSISTRRAIARWYASRLDVLQPDDLNTVLEWISELKLRLAPAGSSLPAHLLAMLLGLRTTLRIKIAINKRRSLPAA